VKASAYIRQFAQEQVFPVDMVNRLRQIQVEIARSGYYRQTASELAYGAKLAWRNNTRCIGRLHWSSLHVRDMRHLTSAEDVFTALIEHIQIATNGGKIRPLMTVFAPQTPVYAGVQIWNSQLIRYAGYLQSDSSILGDPMQAELTSILLKLGWKGGAGTAFDLLPLVIQMPDQPPRIFEIPPEVVLEVPISHPDHPRFAELGLKWYALPVISDMRLEIGGISYTAAPFNGWYMGAEIGARNFGDQDRYNLLPAIAEILGFMTHPERTLWRDRALVELNSAVLHSFALHGVSIVDHHTVCRQFVLHEERECKAGRALAADWGWIVPPLSGSVTPVFHRSYEDKTTTPNFFYQRHAWQSYLPAFYPDIAEQEEESSFPSLYDR
jgi:nitric-oxide synthase